MIAVLARPNANNVCHVLLAAIGLDSSCTASPKGVHAMIGLPSWFCILSRAHYSYFSDAYTFVRETPETALTGVRAEVANKVL